MGEGRTEKKNAGLQILRHQISSKNQAVVNFILQGSYEFYAVRNKIPNISRSLTQIPLPKPIYSKPTYAQTQKHS